MCKSNDIFLKHTILLLFLDSHDVVPLLVLLCDIETTISNRILPNIVLQEQAIKPLPLSIVSQMYLSSVRLDPNAPNMPLPNVHHQHFQPNNTEVVNDLLTKMTNLLLKHFNFIESRTLN